MLMPRPGAVLRLSLGVVLALVAGAGPGFAQATIKGQVAAGTKPAWSKGIVPINPESYYHAIECGKQGGNPACVFWDTGLCKNPDFELAMYTPYKSVAYEVWRVVSQKQPPPQPNYAEAQRTRITIGVTPVRGSKNPLTDLVLKRGGKAVAPTARELTTRRFTFDFPAFAPTAGISIDLIGKERTLTCTIDAATLKLMR
ncbi:MAG TPA: hypothetical protein VM032_20270 [Vicinamibacterales bacterium]|nr:hypothetical protein [Vicinamibacterales bacterium]